MAEVPEHILLKCATALCASPEGFNDPGEEAELASMPSFREVIGIAYAAGHAEGCDAVTELSVANLVDIELDKLEDDGVQAQLADRIRHRLADPDDPYETRAATKEIVESVWHVMERAS